MSQETWDALRELAEVAPAKWFDQNKIRLLWDAGLVTTEHWGGYRERPRYVLSEKGKRLLGR